MLILCLALWGITKKVCQCVLGILEKGYNMPSCPLPRPFWKRPLRVPLCYRIQKGLLHGSFLGYRGDLKGSMENSVCVLILPYHPLFPQ